jgi:hypothetical protein
MGHEIKSLTTALAFAADAHRNQRRKGAAQEPYINHLIEVMDLVARSGHGHDIDVLVAAVLHDCVEDTATSYDDLAARFGERVATIVRENSDDMTLPKSERRRARIAAMPHKSPAARAVKIADVISNLRAIAISPPAGWTAERKLGYLEACRQLIDAGRGADPALEAAFDTTAADVEQAVRDEAPFAVDGHQQAARHLESGVGQNVHTVYLPNTEHRTMDDRDIDKLCEIISRTFPSATVQTAHGIYEGLRRAILMARIRTDSTDAVVALAQRLCHDFEQRFMGIEVNGRYIRVYSDDTM